MQNTLSRKERRVRKHAGQLVGTIGVTSSSEARYTDFALSLLRTATLGAQVVWIRGADIAANRNQIARAATGEWVWFLDDDHSFQADLLPRLLSHKADIVAPVVLMKKPPFYPAASKGLAEGGYEGYKLSDLPTDGSLVEAFTVGTAGLLVRRKVFETLADPWFETGQVSSEHLNEDTYFCQKAREAGFTVWLDTGAALGHLRPVSLLPAVDDEGRWNVAFDFEGTALNLPAP